MQRAGRVNVTRPTLGSLHAWLGAGVVARRCDGCAEASRGCSGRVRTPVKGRTGSAESPPKRDGASKLDERESRRCPGPGCPDAPERLAAALPAGLGARATLPGLPDHPAPESVLRPRGKLKTLMRTGRGRRRPDRVCAELRRILISWLNDFSRAEARSAFERLDGWLRRRRRAVLWRQWNRPGTRRRSIAGGLMPLEPGNPRSMVARPGGMRAQAICTRRSRRVIFGHWVL